MEITIKSLESDEINENEDEDENNFKKADIYNFLKDDMEAESIYDQKRRRLV